MRKTKIEYYLDIAREISMRSPCARRKFGAIVVKNDAIISSGYNGSARGTLNCGIDIPCIKNIANEPPYQSYNMCPAIHAEQNAVLNADPFHRVGATLYLGTSSTKDGDRPCFLCRRHIIQAGIRDIYYVDREGKICHEVVDDFVKMDDEWMMETLERLKPDWKKEIMK